MLNVVVGVPVRNEGQFLRNSLDSLIRNYDYIDEIIISDNNSDDDTKIICQEYIQKYPKIKYYRHESTLRSIDNFKFILKKANSEYFFFFRAKNLISDNFVPCSIELMKESPNSPVVFPLFYKSNDISYSDKSVFFDPTKYKLNSELVYDRVRCVLRYVATCYMIYGFFRTNILKEEFFKLESEEAACDQVLAMRIVIRSPVICDASINVSNYFRKKETIDSCEQRYKKAGFYVEKNNVDWHLLYEFHLLCRLKCPDVYILVKDEINIDLSITRKAHISNEEISLRKDKGKFVDYIAKKSKGKQIGFLGTSNCAEIIHNLLKNRLVPDFYLDNNKSKQGHYFYGKKIFDPQAYLDCNTMTCVVNVNDDQFIWEIYDQLTSLGFVYMENLFFLAREVEEENI